MAMQPNRMSAGVGLAVVLVLSLSVIGCGGDDDSDGGGETAPAEAGGAPLEIDPDEGPAGTAISWSISGCEQSDDKGVDIYAAPLDEYRTGAKAKRIVKGPEGKASSGTVTVPDGTAPGEYTVSGSCLSREELGGGQVQLGVSEQTAAFTVTE